VGDDDVWSVHKADLCVCIEIFLPSYADYQFDTELERRQDPVADIIITDEEVGRMFPE
jgi:hypothetical protein